MKDVIIVGAGPAGLYTALLLLKEGSDVVVLEEHEDVGVPTHCTGLVSGETNRFYKIPEDIVLNRPSACLVVSPAGHVAELEDPGEEIAVLDRAALDRALATSVVEASGVVRIRRAEATRLKAGVLVQGDARTHLQKFLSRPSVASRLREPAGEPIRRLLPVAPVAKSYGNRVVAVGDAAGLTKPVSGGGIFYSLLSAQFAAETLIEAFAADDLSARQLSRYEARWRERLMPEIRTSRWFRGMLAGLADPEWDKLVAALASDDVQAVIRQKARFNWHRSLVLALVRQRGIKSLLLRSLIR